MIEVRRIREPEAAAVAQLWDRMGRELPDGTAMTKAELGRIEFMLRGSAWHHRAFCFVAWDDGRLVGFLNGALDHGDGLLPGVSGEIETCYVIPEARRRGVGSALARAALDWLGEREAGSIRLETWLDAEDAKAFWARHGFEPETICLTRYADSPGG